MAELESEPCISSEEETDRIAAAVREMAATVPMPEGPTSFDTAESDFWRLWRIPVGSVITYAAEGPFPDAEGTI